MIIAIDPGKDKCGLAILSKEGKVLDQRIIPRQKLLTVLPIYAGQYKIKRLVIGQGKFGQELAKEVKKCDLDVTIKFVSEKNSTLEARKLYWQENKPHGLWKLLPVSLRVAPRPLDDYAAVIIGQRALTGK